VSNPRNRKTLVTGADGFIGSHLVERLLDDGAAVTALSLYNSFGTNGWLDEKTIAGREGMTIARGDIRDGDFVRRLVDGHDCVLHLAALIAIPHSYDAARSYVETNVSGTLNLLEAARGTAVSRIVCTSTSEVYGTAQFTPITEDHPLQGQSPYSASKIGADMMAEAYARSFELPVIILRPFNTYGPRQSERAVIPTLIRQALDPACEQILIGDRSPKRDFTYVGDTVAAFLAAASAPLDFGVAYNCGTGEAVTIGEMADRIVALTGCNKEICGDTARMRPERSEVRELCADAARFNAASGWRAETSLEAGLEATIEWWRGRIADGVVRPTSSYLT